MRKLDALNKLYHRPPLNEHIERDFHKAVHDAWLEVANLYDFLEACHKDGVLTDESMLKKLAWIRDDLDEDETIWALDLPPDSPEVIAAENAYAIRAAGQRPKVVHG